MNMSSTLACRSESTTTIMRKIAICLPSSLYAGWITLASTVGALVVGVAYHADNTTLIDGSIVLLLFVLVITKVQIFYIEDVFYTLAVSWGLLGVCAGVSSSKLNDSNPSQMLFLYRITFSAFAGVLFSGVLKLILIFWTCKKNQPVDGEARPLIPQPSQVDEEKSQILIHEIKA